VRLTRLAPAAAAIAVSLGVAACTSLASPPPGSIKPAASAVAAARASARASASAAAAFAAAAVRPISQRAGSAPLVGVDLYLDENYSLAQTKAWGERDLKYLADTLGLKAVAIVWAYNVPSPFSDRVAASPSRTPTTADLAALTSIAASDGLRVEYRVAYDIGNSDLRDESIKPGNLDAWLRSLLAAETPALKLAQADRVSEFVVGTEMASIDQSPAWGGFFARASRLYRGILSYAQWGGKGSGSGLGGFFSPKRVLLPERYYGTSAYPPFTLPVTASVAQLTQAWVAFLQQAPEQLLRLTAIDATAIPAAAGAYYDPYQWTALGDAQADLAVQANWYRAACQAADLVHIRALYFWGDVLSSDPASAQSLVGFEDHPATEAAIRSCP
jgi:hypothetical protein